MTVDRALDTLVVPGFTSLGLAMRSRLSGWPADPPAGALAGKRVAVTGASSGIGTAVAQQCSALGAHVELIVRDGDKGDATAAELPGPATVRVCDLGDLDAVARTAAALREDGVPLHALVHNAGAMPPERTESHQGHELTMALHVLGPVLLTERLLPLLAGGRVVFMTSGGMYLQELRLDDLDYHEQPYSGTRAYARSKRAQVELLDPLQRRWAESEVLVAAAHPGWVDTPGLADSLPGFRSGTRAALRDANAGADTITWLGATPDTPAPAQLWHDRRPRPTARGRRAARSGRSCCSGCSTRPASTPPTPTPPTPPTTPTPPPATPPPASTRARRRHDLLRQDIPHEPGGPNEPRKPAPRPDRLRSNASDRCGPAGVGPADPPG